MGCFPRHFGLFIKFLDSNAGPSHRSTALHAKASPVPSTFSIDLLYSFFKRAPLGVSSITQPFAFRESRKASASLKFFACLAACLCPSRACISGGASEPPLR